MASMLAGMGGMAGLQQMMGGMGGAGMPAFNPEGAADEPEDDGGKGGCGAATLAASGIQPGLLLLLLPCCSLRHGMQAASGRQRGGPSRPLRMSAAAWH
jgi:GTPase involved in cell partitioning and DNA repair